MGRSKKLRNKDHRSKKKLVSEKRKRIELSEGSIVEGNMGDRLRVKDSKFIVEREEKE